MSEPLTDAANECGCAHEGPCRESECGHHAYAHHGLHPTRKPDPTIPSDTYWRDRELALEKALTDLKERLGSDE